MTFESGIFFSLVGVCIAIATFFIGRTTAAKNEGKTEGTAFAEMRKDIEYIAKEIKSIRESLDKRDEKYDDSIKRLHDRMDEHIAKYHSQGA